MSVTITYPIVPQVGAWTLASTLRNILDANGRAVRIELKPQSPFAGDPEFDSSDLSAWTLADPNNYLVLGDANTTLKSRLVMRTASACGWFGSQAEPPFYYQSLSGDFDVAARLTAGSANNYNYASLVAYDSATGHANRNLCWVGIASFVGGVGSGAVWYGAKVTNAAATEYQCVPGATPNSGSGVFSASYAQLAGDGWAFVRLKRSSLTFTAYCSADAKTWTQMYSNTYSSFNSSAKVGVAVTTGGTSSISSGATCDWIRNALPYDTTSPVASVVLDSGVNGTAWNMSSFQDYLNPYMEFAPYSQIGFGTLKYDYGASDSSPPSLSGTYRTTSQMQALSNPSGRYFKLSVQFNSSAGYDLASFCGASIQGTFSSGGGGSRGIYTGGRM